MNVFLVTCVLEYLLDVPAGSTQPNPPSIIGDNGPDPGGGGGGKGPNPIIPRGGAIPIGGGGGGGGWAGFSLSISRAVLSSIIVSASLSLAAFDLFRSSSNVDLILRKLSLSVL